MQSQAEEDLRRRNQLLREQRAAERENNQKEVVKQRQGRERIASERAAAVFLTPNGSRATARRAPESCERSMGS